MIAIRISFKEMNIGRIFSQISISDTHRLLVLDINSVYNSKRN